MKKVLLAAATAAWLVLIFGSAKASPARPAAGDKYQVRIDNFTFTPATLTVPVGTTVTWINQDDVPHTLVSSEGKTLKSPVLDTDDRFSFTFTRPGTYPYFCSIHPRMIGKVVVQ